MTSIEKLVYNLVYNNLVDNSPNSKLWEIVEQAKEMHKQEIIQAHDMGYIMGGNHKKVTAEMYYAETYVSKGSAECPFFISLTKTTSATICSVCGREKSSHKL